MKIFVQGSKVGLVNDDGNVIQMLSPNAARRLALAMFQHADQISKVNKRRRKRKK